MKLELKHLAPYLPYGLKIQTLNRRENLLTYKLVIGLSENAVTYEFLKGCAPDRLPFKDVKPILRPLSDLTKEINYGLSTYAFTDLFEIGDCDGCVFEFEHGNIKTIKALESIAKYNLHNDINYLPNAVVNMMYEYHFDVFGLIDKNLAIDINTL